MTESAFARVGARLISFRWGRFVSDNLPKSRAEANSLGSMFYFTGKPCKNGHVANRRTVNGACDECVIERRNSEQYKIVTAIKEKRHWADQVWRAAKKEKHTKWLLENPSYPAISTAKWRNENKEYRKKYLREYRQNNKEKVRNNCNKRRARKRHADGLYTHDDIDRIRKAQKDKCAICRCSLKGGGQRDHIIPLAGGGSNWPGNIQLLCSSCNSSKGARDPLEFMQSRGLLL